MKTRESLLRAIESARRHLLHGRPARAVLILGRAARKVCADLEEWVAFLTSAAELADVCDRLDLAARWIERTEEELRRRKPQCGEERARLSREIHLLKLWVRFRERGIPGVGGGLERAFLRIQRWKPWMLRFRWNLLLSQGRLDDFAKLLRHPPECAIRPGTLAYAVRIYNYGLFWFLKRQFRKAALVTASAVKKCEKLTCPLGLFYRATCLCWASRLETDRGNHDEGLRLALRAEAIVERIATDRLRHLLYNAFGHVWYCSGDYEKALRTQLKICLSTPLSNRTNLSAVTIATMNAARNALRLGRRGQARRLLRRAAPLVRAYPHPWHRGYLYLLRGDLHRDSDTPSGYRNARRLYRAAQTVFEAAGAADYWLHQVHLSRGKLCIKERRFVEAREQADVCVEVGKKTGLCQFQVDGLLLKSFLLLDDGAPRVEIYETILREMGVVKDPVVLFKILANLYIYSWDLGDQLDLTDLHLKQLDRLRDAIPAKTYERLYQTLVTERVVGRFHKRFASGASVNRRAVSF